MVKKVLKCHVRAHGENRRVRNVALTQPGLQERLSVAVIINRVCGEVERGCKAVCRPDALLGRASFPCNRPPPRLNMHHSQLEALTHSVPYSCSGVAL